MKSLFFSSLIFAELLLNCIYAKAQEQNIVGRVENGNPVLTASPSDLILNLSCNLKKYSGIKAAFTKVSIITDGEVYFLHFVGGSYVSNLRLIVEDSGYLKAGTTTCTTSDCSSETYGCTPDIYGACRPCSTGACTKTTSTISLIAACDK